MNSAVAGVPETCEVIRRADVIVCGPGSLFTSILPPLLVPQVADEIRRAAGVRLHAVLHDAGAEPAGCADAVAFWDDVNRQDWDIVERSQLAVVRRAA